MNAQETPNQLNIEISEEVAEGEYANLAIITHSHAEFVIDFVNVMPGTPKSKVKSRIILTPQHAKRFMKALTENLTALKRPMERYRSWRRCNCPSISEGLPPRRSRANQTRAGHRSGRAARRVDLKG